MGLFERGESGVIYREWLPHSFFLQPPLSPSLTWATSARIISTSSKLWLGTVFSFLQYASDLLSLSKILYIMHGIVGEESGGLRSPSGAQCSLLLGLRFETRARRCVNITTEREREREKYLKERGGRVAYISPPKRKPAESAPPESLHTWPREGQKTFQNVSLRAEFFFFEQRREKLSWEAAFWP